MDIQLDQVEARILGSFIEKELTTPDHYPLSLNALTNACNQKSNRQPVMELEETSLLRSLDRLRHLGLAMQSQGTGSRVAKYRHTLREKLHLDEAELAILAELLLRGPQTLGELRGRADRMQSLPSLEAAEEVLQELLDRDQPLAIKLPRQAGRKECRYAHLLCGPPEEEVTDAPAEPARLQVQAENERIARLEEELTVLRQEMNELKQELAAFRAQFE